MQPLKQQGNVLLFIIVGMTLVAVLGTGIYFVTTTSTFSGLAANDQNRAYQLALAGRDYALAKNLPSTAGTDFTFANGDKFRLEIGQGNPDEIKSTGIVKKGTPYEAKHTITITKTGFSSQADVSFAKDIQSFSAPTQSQTGFITTDTATGKISLGKTTMTQTFGAVWYKGGAAAGNCVDGKCDFGKGFNAFFVFQFASGSKADGFTFAFFNGGNNLASSVGGYTGRGELMGYAGNSLTSSGTFLDGRGHGIQPPKIAIEFDPYANKCNTLCDGAGASDGSRCDDMSSSLNNNERNHMALMFWGDNAGGCGSTVGQNTFDDNRHCAGGGSNVSFSNASNPQQLSPCTYNNCHYFDGNNNCSGSVRGWPGNWLLNTTLPNVYALRLEVSRKLTPETASGDFEYRIKAWIEKCSEPTCISNYAEDADYLNTKKDYTATNPIIDRKIEIKLDYHNLFEKMFFGWTTATGGEAQEVKISRFRINFQK